MQQNTEIYQSQIDGVVLTQAIDEEHENGWCVHSMVSLRLGLNEGRFLVVYRKEKQDA